MTASSGKTEAQAALLVAMGMPWISQAVYAVTKVGVPDALAEGPLPVAELAERTGAHPDALRRFCRAMEAIGLLTEPEAGVFGLSPQGHLLRSGELGALRDFVIAHGEAIYQAWGEAEYVLRTGAPAFEKVHGSTFFDYLSANPDAAGSFNAMFDPGLVPGVLRRCDFSDADVVVDVGGGTGAVLSSVLRRHPEARGVLQDTPEVVAGAAEVLRRAGTADRCETVGGDFFTQVVPGGDVYLLCRVVHDWPDQEALRLLRRVRQAMKPDSRLVIVDPMIPPGLGFHPAKLLDISMLVLLGGRERTVAEYEGLLDRAGLRVITRHLPPGPAFKETAMEAVPA